MPITLEQLQKADTKLVRRGSDVYAYRNNILRPVTGYEDLGVDVQSLPDISAGTPDVLSRAGLSPQMASGGAIAGSALIQSVQAQLKDIEQRAREAEGARVAGINRPADVVGAPLSVPTGSPADINLQNEMQRRAGGVQGGLQGAAQGLYDLLQRANVEGITGLEGGDVPPGFFTGKGISGVGAVQPPTAPPVAPTAVPTAVPTATPAVSPVAPVAPQAPSADPKDQIIQQLLETLKQTGAAPKMEDTYTKLKEEAGIPQKRAQVGTLDVEINKARDLLSDLEQRIRGGVAREEARLAPMELLTGRQAELARQGSLQSQDVLGTIETLQRTREAAERDLSREEQDVLTRLGLKEKDLDRPLEDIQRKVSILSNLKNIAQKDIPNTVSSQLNDEGDLTIVIQDPATGEYSTKVLSGVGKQAAQYSNVTSTTDNEGNVTFFGVDKQGNPHKLGSFEGVAKQATKEPTQTEKDRLLREQIVSKAKPVLDRATGSDGYVDPAVYLDLRQQYFEAFRNTSGFDDLFSARLNPISRERYSIGRIGVPGGAKTYGTEDRGLQFDDF